MKTRILITTVTIIVLSFGAFAQNVNIPDANLKAALVANNSINSNQDSEIQISEAAAYTGGITLVQKGIVDMTGIEAFTSIKSLKCYANDIVTLDVTKNTALTYLDCNSNEIDVLDVSQNTGLTYLNCYGNNLTELNLRKNVSLVEFHCHFNDLTDLDLTQNTALEIVYAGANKLKALDVSRNTALTRLFCNSNNLKVLNLKNITLSNLVSFDASSQLWYLTCIDVDDVAYANANMAGLKDASVSYSLDCKVDVVTAIKVEGENDDSTITVQGGTLQMDAIVTPSYADNTNYTWTVTNGTGVATIDATGLLTATADGKVTVTATASDGSAVVGNKVITISNQATSSVENSTFKEVYVYPNPVNSRLTIASTYKIENIQVVDFTGKLVRLNLGQNLGQNQSIDVSGLPKGIYFLQIQIGEGLIQRKFTKI